MTKEIVQTTRQTKEGGLYTKMFFEDGVLLDGDRTFQIDISTARLKGGDSYVYETMGFARFSLLVGQKVEDCVIYGPERTEKKAEARTNHSRAIEHFVSLYFK